MNDLINYSIREAIREFGGSGNIFTKACLSVSICKIAKISSGQIDGRIIEVILTGRSDVERLKGGSHYRLIEANA